MLTYLISGVLEFFLQSSYMTKREGGREGGRDGERKRENIYLHITGQWSMVVTEPW